MSNTPKLSRFVWGTLRFDSIRTLRLDSIRTESRLAYEESTTGETIRVDSIESTRIDNIFNPPSKSR